MINKKGMINIYLSKKGDTRMKKRDFLTAIGASVIGASVASYFLMNDEQKANLKNKLNNKSERLSGMQPTTIEKAGKPDQVTSKDEADLENAKMVSEGSQFGVQYYTEMQDET